MARPTDAPSLICHTIRGKTYLKTRVYVDGRRRAASFGCRSDDLRKQPRNQRTLQHRNDAASIILNDRPCSDAHGVSERIFRKAGAPPALG
jgi:hypothetical protein